MERTCATYKIVPVFMVTMIDKHIIPLININTSNLAEDKSP